MNDVDGDGGQLVAVRSFTATDDVLGLALVTVGTVLPTNHRLARARPENFVPVGNGVDERRAWVAPQRISHAQPDGELRVIEQGQWVDEDDPLRRMHPDVGWRRP